MESGVGVGVSGTLPAKAERYDAAREWAVAVAIIYSVVLAAGGGYVFYASLRPVSIPTGYFAFMGDYPWVLTFLPLAAVWGAGSLILLVLGLIQLRRHDGHRWRAAAGWLVALAAGAAIGFLIVHDYSLLLTSFPRDLDGTALGPSRWAPGGPYWPALLAAGGELAVAAVMIALVKARPGLPLTGPSRQSR